ncbi:saccharopine dehydrogenase NADP-binding domain-containing protein [Nonomuraea jiangxiensis]|uniref:Saccharopine dehydrogenase NADP binding domain-containing protein n=1 Tax=Nonomuraea jiangxiensis TaxID=633440 RepID=A0A1G9LGZ5_9ACTN|nr:saccharopine dehydrogenase NADP-binding domain-containing protein [Nonomuraea jiangxiensis]SDL60765.1 Saccharopine dehydrogenase NADP binding domain-containing protein [Nonomuraea jiangxiensis]
MTTGVIGCYGAVGRALVRRLPGPLRLGGRDLDRVRQTARPGDEAVAVDLCQADRLARFCAGCDIVVNCAGPSARVQDTVAQAALRAGAHYVDVAGDQLDHARLSALAGGRSAVLAAGMMPGLSALLPRALAQGAGRPVRLVAHAGGLDRFTRAAALDYVASLSGDYAVPLAAWQGHQVIRGALRPAERVALPHFPGRVSAYPYLSRETERLARTLGLAEVEWWGVFDGERTLRALSGAGDRDAERVAGDLELAARLDGLGRRPYFQLVFDLDGRVLLVRAADGYELTAALAATATREVATGRVPPGAHDAADVLDPGGVLRDLRDDPAVEVLEPSRVPVEEGVL